MRRAAKIDGNHKDVVTAFEKFGCSVLLLHSVGGGCPDICVGKNKKSVLVEIKDPNKFKSERTLTKDQIKFHSNWLGSLFVVETLGDVIDLVKGLDR